jgi:hypothetical protein
MKTLLIFLLGAAIGIIAYQYFKEDRALRDTKTVAEVERTPSGTTTTTTTTPAPAARPSMIDQARDTAVATKDAIANKFAEWRLNAPEIKEELARTGRVVRSKTEAAGHTIATSVDNGRIVSFIKAKYAFDKDLSARAIDVDAANGKVTLRGTVSSPELLGKAVALALDTEGVMEVNSLLTVATP